MEEYDSDSSISIMEEIESGENMNNIFLENISNYNLIRLDGINFKKICSMISKERFYSLIIELDPGSLIEISDYIPIRYVIDLLNILSIEKLRVITSNMNDINFCLLVKKFSDKQLEDILLFITNNRLIILYETLVDKRKFIIDNIIPSQFQFILDNIKDQNLDLINISSYLELDQIDFYRKYIENDMEILSQVILNIKQEYVKNLLNSLNSKKCLEIIENIDNSEEKTPSFLEICISLNYSLLKSHAYKYFPHFTTKEISIFFEILDKDSVKEAFIFCNYVPMEYIVPTFNCLKVREIIRVLSDDILVQVFKNLSENQQIFSFSNLSVSQFWKIVPTLDREQFSKIIPYIAYDHKENTIVKHFHLNEEVIEYYLESYQPYIIGLGFSFIQIKPKIIKSSNSLTRQQLYFSLPILEIDDIFEILEIVSDSNKIMIINNITENQLLNIENELILNIGVVKLQEIFLKRICEDFENELIKIEEYLNKDEYFDNEFKINDVMIKIQSNYLQILHKKYDLKKDVDKYTYFIEKMETTYRLDIIELMMSLENIFKKIYSFQERVDKGDSITGIINMLTRLKNKKGLTKSPSTSGISDSLLRDESIVANNENVWLLYNEARETFSKIFEENEMDDTGLSWEDLINHNLITEENYMEKNITTVDELIEYVNNRGNSGPSS